MDEVHSRLGSDDGVRALSDGSRIWHATDPRDDGPRVLDLDGENVTGAADVPPSWPTPAPHPGHPRQRGGGVVGGRESEVVPGGSVLPLYTPAEAARLLSVRESWLRRRATARAVPCTFVGKHLRFSHADVVAIAQAGARRPGPPPRPGRATRRGAARRR